MSPYSANDEPTMSAIHGAWPATNVEIGDTRGRECHGHPLRAIESLRQHEDAQHHVEQRADEVGQADFEHVVMVHRPREAQPVHGDEERAGHQAQEHATRFTAARSLPSSPMAREPTEREHAGPDDAMRRDLRGGHGLKPD